MERPELAKADLSGLDLKGLDFRRANLRGANLSHTRLKHAQLTEANLTRTRLNGANLTCGKLAFSRLYKADLYRSNLVSADLTGANLQGANLRGANLANAKLFEADLREADLGGAKLVGAQLNGACLDWANLELVDLKAARLDNASFKWSTLTSADLSYASLLDVDFSGAVINEANFWRATVGGIKFTNLDLSTAQGLDQVLHKGPSSIGVDTLFRSDGRMPDEFLRGAGIPEDFISFIPSLLGRAIEFYSSFISYSHKDEDFSRRLHSRMRDENLRVWYSPEDMKGGTKLHEEIFRAIQIHDKLLLVLSENSMKSEWVITEIRRARKVEREEKRRKLFPIRLVNFENIQSWECFDSDSGKDLAAELREYYIPDFSNWRDHGSFEKEFAKLLRDLRATER